MTTAPPLHPLTSSPSHRLIPDEPLLLSTRPGFLFVLIYRQGWWLIPPLILWAIYYGLARLITTDPAPWLSTAALAWLALGLLWRLLAWLCRRYVLTDQRALVIVGVISRAAGDVPLRNIQNTSVTQSPLERLFNLGTIGISTAAGPALNWLMVPRPHAVLDALRRAADTAKRQPAAATPLTSSPPHLFTSSDPPVIGLAGAPGAGKSEVARILASLGAVVIDSDTQAKEALDQPEVRSQLVQWWGPSILDARGCVSRRTVADIIFDDPAQRRRLESVVHPIVRTRRAAAKRAAAQRHAPAVVIDAPLLFEAGVDQECDRIIFVDAPRAARLARVRDSRNWDDAELARREAAQLGEEEKRRRSDVVILNDGPPDALRPAVQAAFDQIVRPR